MHSSELDVLLRTSRGNVPQIVRNYIFTQDELSDADHAFLDRHRAQLNEEDLLNWLCRRPPNSGSILKLLLRKVTSEDLALRWAISSGSVATWLSPEVFDDLVEHMRPSVELFLWWSWAKHIQTGCALYRKLLAEDSSEAPALAYALFPLRRDERRLLGSLRDLVRTGKGLDGAQLPTSPWTHSKPEPSDLDPSAAGERETLTRKARIVAFLERQELLSHLDPRDVLPERVRFSVEDEVLRFNTPEYFFLSLALRWPNPAARQWYARQFLDAAGRGARWEDLLDEMLGSRNVAVESRRGHTSDTAVASAVLEQVAIESWGLPNCAPWLGSVVLGRMKTGSPEEWELAFAYLDRLLRIGRPDPEMRLLLMELRRADIPLLANVSTGRVVVGILQDAPLPAVVDDAFDAKLLSYAPLLRPFSFGDGYLVPFRRLASMPRTAERAKRLLTMALEYTDLFHEAPGSVWEEIADLAGPIAPDRLPEVEEFLHLIREVDPPEREETTSTGVPSAEHLHQVAERARINDLVAIRVYRRLVGPDAEEMLRRWVWSPLEEEPSKRRPGALNHVFHNLKLVPEALDADLRATIRGFVDRFDFAELAELHESALEWASAERVAEAAQANVADPSVDWSWFLDRPRSWMSKQLLFARTTVASEHEFRRILEWLRENGCREQELLPVLLAKAQKEHREDSALWDVCARQLGETLSSGSLWTRHGPHTIRSLLADGAWAILLGAVRHSAQGNQPLGEMDRERYRTVIGAAHEAMAVVMIERLRDALRIADGDVANRALRTLLALHAPGRLSKRLYSLRKLASFSADVRELFEINVRMMRHGSARDATFTDLECALRIWFEAEVPDNAGGERNAENAA